MKKIIFGVMALMSISAFASPKSDFERGFEAGVASSQSENLYVCKVSFETNERVPTAAGLSRGLALQRLFGVCSILSGPQRVKLCIEALETCKAECTTL